MAIFNPVDMMGPAHRGASVQQLAQSAAQNVMRRQKMRALLSGSARAAAGGGQPIRSSINARPTGLHGATLRSAAAPQGFASILAGMANGTQALGSPDDGSQGASGGGYDYPSIADPTDPAQSPTSEQPGSATPVPGAPAPGQSSSAGVTNVATGGGSDVFNVGGTFQDTSGLYGEQGDFVHTQQGNGMIHLGGGLYYDPATDSVRGGSPTAGR